MENLSILEDDAISTRFTSELESSSMDSDNNSDMISYHATPEFRTADYESLSQEPNNFEFTVCNALETLDDEVLSDRAIPKVEFEGDGFLQNIETDSKIVMTMTSELDDDDVDLDVVQFATGQDPLFATDSEQWELLAIDLDDEYKPVMILKFKV